MFRSGSAPNLVAPRRLAKIQLPALSALAMPPPVEKALPESGATCPRGESIEGAPVVKKRSDCRSGSGSERDSGESPPVVKMHGVRSGSCSGSDSVESSPLAKRRSGRSLRGCSEETPGSAAVPTCCQVSYCFTSECSTPKVSIVGSSGRRRNASTSALKRQEKGSSLTKASPPTTAKTSQQQWIKGKALGAGSFGTVFYGLDPTKTHIFAVKEVPLDEAGTGKTKEHARLESELTICQALRHPNIVSYLGHEYAEHSLCIFLEYVPGGSMACVLSEFGALGGKTLRKATLGTLEGLDYLHTRSPPIVHRDLKGAKLLVDLDMTVKLADFGCSKMSSGTRAFTTVGSVPWMAPEVIAQNEGYGRKADVWSFGCTVIEMATGEKPWGNGSFDNLMFALNHTTATPSVPEHVPAKCRDLIQLCTTRDQNERPATTQLLQHNFLSPTPANA